MNKTDTEKIFRFYHHIDDDIRMCKASLTEYEERYNTMGAIPYDGMPKGSGISDKVAKRAIKNVEADTKAHIDFLHERIRELNRTRTEILRELTTLQMIHKLILTEFYIKGMKWEQIAAQAGYSVRQTQNHRTKALEIMAKKITKNRYLSQSEFIRKQVL